MPKALCGKVSATQIHVVVPTVITYDKQKIVIMIKAKALVYALQPWLPEPNSSSDNWNSIQLHNHDIRYPANNKDLRPYTWRKYGIASENVNLKRYIMNLNP